ncbi:MAG: hypothetical protein AB8H79_00755 [Myxococcota bacterium]
MAEGVTDTHRDHVRDRTALRRKMTFPAQSAGLHGMMAPSLLMSPLFLMALEGNPVSLLPLLAAVVGGCVGLFFGAIDVPGRAAAALADREDLLALMVMSILAGAVLGAMWGGATGAVLGAVFYTYNVLGVTFQPSEFAGMIFGGSLMGAFAATPGVTLFSLARGLLVGRSGPWWLANIAGMAATIGAVSMLVLMWSVLGMMVVIAKEIW